MKSDKVTYITSPALNGSLGEALYSKLLATLAQGKQASGPASQWAGIVRGFAQKGIKGAEIEDSGVLTYLESLPPAEKVTREQLCDQIKQRIPRIKQVELGAPKYSEWRNMNVGQYKERLYILASEAMAADDRMEDLHYQIQDLAFNPAPLLKDPGLVDRLEREMQWLRQARPQMWDFQHHHFSNVSQEHGKNVMAHARTTEIDDLFFIEEIQSDWAQKGRRYNWGAGYPKAPFVTNTELWAGLVAKDLIHKAASNGFNRVAWINWNMRNGWDGGSGSVQDDAFYRQIIPKIINKAIEKAGGRVAPMEVQTRHGPKSVLGFEITASVREALVMSQPLYSRAGLLPYGSQPDTPERIAERALILNECRQMLGSIHTIRFVSRLYDFASGNEVAGRYLSRGIEISLRAKDLRRTARHEAWHFAHENLLLDFEKREMRMSFSEGTRLNDLTRATLLRAGEFEAAAQCNDPQECAAHAFALWSEQRLQIELGPEAGLFERVTHALDQISAWLDERIFGVKVSTPEDLFKAMRAGTLAVKDAPGESSEPSRSREHFPTF
jgi:hypothetical protein